MKKQIFAFLTTLTVAGCALAQVSVTQPWIRATVAQAQASGAFMTLTSVHDARLIEVRSSAAGSVEIHRMSMVDHVMKMHAISSLDLPAGKSVNLASGGYHVMLMGLKRQLQEGDSVPLVLIVENGDKTRQTIELTVPVKALTYAAPVGAVSAPAHGAMTH
jgi:copper(I)-binding protein